MQGSCVRTKTALELFGTHSLTSIIECRKKIQKPTFACFVDFSKAYDNVKHGLLWKKLQDMKFPDEMLRMLKCIYRENTNCVSGIRVSLKPSGYQQVYGKVVC